MTDNRVKCECGYRCEADDNFCGGCGRRNVMPDYLGLPFVACVSALAIFAGSIVYAAVVAMTN